jgi:hypothetical protein
MYVVVTTGLAVTVARLVALKPVDGDHVYEEPPEAVNATEVPEQIVALEGVRLSAQGG